MKRCAQCGGKLSGPEVTHCSDECLFKGIRNSKSISGKPVEFWGDNDPWI